MTNPTAPRRSGSRSRRSHASFSDLRLAPLSTPAPAPQAKPEKSSLRLSLDGPRTPGSIDPSIAHAYKLNHPSYLTGRSAPSTPGILSRSSSRKANADGLSRNILYTDDEDENAEPNPAVGYFDSPAYAPVRTDAAGAINARSAHVEERGKSKSETGLHGGPATGRKGKQPRPLSGFSRTPGQATPRGRATGGGAAAAAAATRRRSIEDETENWLLHATSFTTSLLQEGKAGSWVASSHPSAIDLRSAVAAAPMSSIGTAPHTYTGPYGPASSDDDDDDDDDDNDDRHRRYPALRHAATAPPAAFDNNNIINSSLPSPSPGAHGWSSRFGSRHASAAPSRRNSRVGMLPRSAVLSGLTTPGGGGGGAAGGQQQRPGTSGSIDALVQTCSSSSCAGPVMRPDFVDAEARAEMEKALAQEVRTRGRLEQQQQQYHQQQGQGQGQQGYFDFFQATDDHFQDQDRIADRQDSDGDEAEVERLARTPGFGLGGFGIIDRLVGLGGFDGTGDEEEEEEEEDEAELGREGRHASSSGTKGSMLGSKGSKDGSKTASQESKEGGRREEGNRGRRSVMLDLQGWFGEQKKGEKETTAAASNAVEGEGEGGWSDAAWLLSVASKALLS